MIWYEMILTNVRIVKTLESVILSKDRIISRLQDQSKEMISNRFNKLKVNQSFDLD